MEQAIKALFAEIIKQPTFWVIITLGIVCIIYCLIRIVIKKNKKKIV